MGHHQLPLPRPGRNRRLNQGHILKSIKRDIVAQHRHIVRQRLKRINAPGRAHQARRQDGEEAHVGPHIIKNISRPEMIHQHLLHRQLVASHRIGRIRPAGVKSQPLPNARRHGHILLPYRLVHKAAR